MTRKKPRHRPRAAPADLEIEMPARRLTSLRRWLPILFLAIVASAGYVNADHEELVFDSQHLRENPRIADSSAMWRSLWQSGWRPGSHLSYLTFAANRALNEHLGLPPFDVTSFVVVNVLLHVFNVCLVYVLVRALLRRSYGLPSGPIGIPLLAAMVFAVHPLHVNSVTYIVQRRGLMAVLFYLLAVVVYLRIPAAGRLSRRLALGAAIVVLYVLSFKSKTMGLTLPLALLAIEFCLRAADAPRLKRSLRWWIPGAVVSLAGMFLFAWSRGLFDVKALRIESWSEDMPGGAWEYFLTEARVFVHYWKLLLFPLPRWLCVDHDFTISRSLLSGFSGAAVALHGLLIAAAVVAAARRFTLLAAGILWFYLSLIPWVILAQTEPFVEYKTYLGSVGLTFVLAELLWRLRRRVPLIGQATVCGVAAVILLSITVSRNAVFADSLTFWLDVTAKSPRNPRAYLGAAKALADRNRTDEAIGYLQAALRERPDYAAAHYNLGLAHYRQGRTEQAVEAFRSAIREKHDFTDARYNLGNALFRMRRFEEAIGEFREVLAGESGDLDAAIMLGNARMESGNLDEAIAEFRSALQGGSDGDAALLAKAHFNLGVALGRKQAYDEAVQALREAVRLEPNYTDAYVRLGQVLYRQGKTPEAVAALRKALQLKPNHAQASRLLKGILARPVGGRSGQP